MLKQLNNAKKMGLKQLQKKEQLEEKPYVQIFGAPLDMNTKQIPIIMHCVVEYFENCGVEYEGLFRLSGAASEMKAIIDHFEHGGIDIPPNTDVHVIASMLKQYLRDMPEPLVPFEFYQTFMNITETIKDDAEFIPAIQSVLQTLPQTTRIILKYLCKFLRMVSEKASINKMTPSNIAIVFAPNILRPPGNDIFAQMQDSGLANRLFQIIILQFDAIFKDEPDPAPYRYVPPNAPPIPEKPQGLFEMGGPPPPLPPKPNEVAPKATPPKPAPRAPPSRSRGHAGTDPDGLQKEMSSRLGDSGGNILAKLKDSKTTQSLGSVEVLLAREDVSLADVIDSPPPPKPQKPTRPPKTPEQSLSPTPPLRKMGPATTVRPASPLSSLPEKKEEEPPSSGGDKNESPRSRRPPPNRQKSLGDVKNVIVSRENAPQRAQTPPQRVPTPPHETSRGEGAENTNGGGAGQSRRGPPVRGSARGRGGRGESPAGRSPLNRGSSAGTRGGRGDVSSGRREVPVRGPDSPRGRGNRGRGAPSRGGMDTNKANPGENPNPQRGNRGRGTNNARASPRTNPSTLSKTQEIPPPDPVKKAAVVAIAGLVKPPSAGKAPPR